MADLRAKAYGLAALIFAADRITKMIVEARVSAIDTIHVIPGFFDIIHSKNRGVAFGMFDNSTSEWRTISLIVLACAAVIFVSSLLWRPEKLDRTVGREPSGAVSHRDRGRAPVRKSERKRRRVFFRRSH